MSNKLASFQEIMIEEAARQHDFEINREVMMMNRDATHSSLRNSEGEGNTSTGNRVASLNMQSGPSPYQFRDPGADLIDAILNATWIIRKMLEAHPTSKEIQDALEMAVGLSQESSIIVIKTLPHIRALIPDYVPDRDLLMKALKQAQRYAEEELNYAPVGLGNTVKV